MAAQGRGRAWRLAVNHGCRSDVQRRGATVESPRLRGSFSTSGEAGTRHGAVADGYRSLGRSEMERNGKESSGSLSFDCDGEPPCRSQDEDDGPEDLRLSGYQLVRSLESPSPPFSQPRLDLPYRHRLLVCQQSDPTGWIRPTSPEYIGFRDDCVAVLQRERHGTRCLIFRRNPELHEYLVCIGSLQCSRSDIPKT